MRIRVARKLWKRLRDDPDWRPNGDTAWRMLDARTRWEARTGKWLIQPIRRPQAGRADIPAWRARGG